MQKTLHQITIQKLKKLKNEKGINLDVITDYHHVVALDALARIVAGESSSPHWQATLDQVRQVGNVTLRRLSLAAELFLFKHLSTWQDAAPPELQNLSIPYALAHADNPATFQDADPQKWFTSVEKWALTVSAPLDALMSAVNDFLGIETDNINTENEPDNQHNDEPDELTDYGWMIEFLTREYGHDPDFWLWGAPACQARLLLDEYRRMRDQEAKASQNKAVAPDPNSRSIRALVEMRKRINQIIAEKTQAHA